MAGALINKSTIGRDETETLLTALDANQDIILFGGAGSGKSSVLYELMERLPVEKFVTLPVRLDRRLPQHTAQQFGEALGLSTSPPKAVVGVAKGRRAVLIIDQLDTLRWTARHSGEALDVCKEMLNEVRELRIAEYKINVVWVCRSYDLQHDPELKRAFADTEEEKFRRIPVGPLSDQKISDVLGSIAFASLTPRQQRVLANPQNLSMWVELGLDQSPSILTSSTGLMRTFWQNRRTLLETMGVTNQDLGIFLTGLLNVMENRGVISVPLSIPLRTPRVFSALKSLEILQIDGKQVSFHHQTYLDYLLAERTMEKVFNGETTVESWLGLGERQTLSRREQLRQVLTLLIEEVPSEFIKTAKSLLTSTAVRFHLKHLIFEVLGEVSDVEKIIGCYLLEVWKVPIWTDFVFDSVLVRHEPWVRFAHEGGLISEWLDSGLPDSEQKAYRLIRSITEIAPDLVVDILAPRLGNSVVVNKEILDSLSLRSSAGSQRMRELYVKLIRLGCLPGYVNWREIANEHPVSALEVVAALLDQLPADKDARIKTGKVRIYRLNHLDIEGLLLAADKEPSTAWHLLFPILERFMPAACDNFDYEESRLWDSLASGMGQDVVSICRGALEICSRAAGHLALKAPEAILLALEPFLQDRRPQMIEILFSAHTYLEPDRADVAISWLLRNSYLLTCGREPGKSCWEPARQLMLAHSQHCSDENFKKLETAIVNYHSPNEREEAGYAMKKQRKCVYYHYWGTTQYHLLPALDSNRMSQRTVQLLPVLGRKFEGYSSDSFQNGPIHYGGVVSSPISKDPVQLSDQSWLGIVSNESIPQKFKGFRTKLKGGFTESSVEQFANALGAAAEKQPSRFLQLSKRFPPSTDARYFVSLLYAFERTEPEPKWPDAIKLRWASPRIELLDELFSRLRDQFREQAELARAFCRILSVRAEESWSHETLGLLVDCSEHPDPVAGTLNIYRVSSEGRADLELLTTNAINCVRGAVARAIGCLLWKESGRLDLFRTALASLSEDPHAAVRLAVVYAVCPILNIDRQLAIKLFLSLEKSDPRIAAFQESLKIIRHIFSSNKQAMEPIIGRLACSEDPDQYRAGIALATFCWINYGEMRNDIENCISVGGERCAIIAEVVSQGVATEQIMDRCRELSLALLRDAPSASSKMLSHILRDDSLVSSPGGTDFLRKLIQTGAFASDTATLVDGLERLGTELIPVADIVLTVCAQSIKAGADSGDFSFFRVSDLWTVLLRLYDQAEKAQDSEVFSSCLDVWDQMFEHRIGSGLQLSKSIQN